MYNSVKCEDYTFYEKPLLHRIKGWEAQKEVIEMTEDKQTTYEVWVTVQKNPGNQGFLEEVDARCLEVGLDTEAEAASIMNDLVDAWEDSQ